MNAFAFGAEDFQGTFISQERSSINFLAMTFVAGVNYTFRANAVDSMTRLFRPGEIEVMVTAPPVVSISYRNWILISEEATFHVSIESCRPRPGLYTFSWFEPFGIRFERLFA
ncbi:MAG: hypothetical protein GY774_28295 [Planctomycetes bacterium]|nr:hypothetical protein [Planctomycetota bacterium]